MPIRAVIFDMGGVINRSMDETPRRLLAERLGVPVDSLYKLVFDSESARRASVGEISVIDHWQAVQAALNVPPAEMGGVQAQFWQGDQVDYALVDYIRSLRGRYKVAMLSNAWDDLRTVLSERWKIADAFDEIIISAEVRLAKPDARIYQLALERLGVSAGEAVFVDDFSRNIAAAQELGLHTVHFHSPEQARAELESLLNGHA
jgi:epoxide hydrolase-like predicted phosphatase